MSSISSFVSSGDIEGLAAFCEGRELVAPLGVTSPEIYGTLLAVYMLQNELDHAKLLWKRIPGAIKADNAEIPALWEIGKRLWRREFGEVYPLMDQQQWSANIQPLLNKLRDKLRERVINLIGRAYSNISLDQVNYLLGTPEDQTLSIIKDKSWEVNNRTVCPRPDPVVFSHTDDSVSQDRLAQLVDIVSFLEN